MKTSRAMSRTTGPDSDFEKALACWYRSLTMGNASEKSQGSARKRSIVTKSGGNVGLATMAQGGQQHVLERRQGSRRIALVHLAAILKQSHVTHVVNPVLDRPVAAPEWSSRSTLFYNSQNERLLFNNLIGTGSEAPVCERWGCKAAGSGGCRGIWQASVALLRLLPLQRRTSPSAETSGSCA